MENSMLCGFDETAYKLATFFVPLTEVMILQYLFEWFQAMRNVTSPIAREGFCKPMYFEENIATENVYARNPSHVIGITKKSSKQ